jgi:hypothetical protein
MNDAHENHQPVTDIVWAYEFEQADGTLDGRRRRVLATESLTVKEKSTCDTMIKVETAEGWIAWAPVEDLIKITLH